MPPLITIVGETASGKSELAMMLAEYFNGELICADSWTVYKGFDIGTAKPSKQDRLRIPHHLLDIADANQGFSAVLFKELAQEAIQDISSRNKLPILVGGTGLYIDSVLFDYSFLPKSDPSLRAELEGYDLSMLIKRAEDLNLNTAGVDVRNKRRLIRLIENNGKRPAMSPMRDNTFILGVHAPREVLGERISSRVDLMLGMGLVDEVQSLSYKYGWDVEPMKGIGYKEFREYLSGSSNLDEARAKLIKNTLDLAKRQRTWFKRNPSIHWVDDRSNIVDIVTTFLNKTNSL